MKFEKWFHEISPGGFTLRSEYFYDDVETPDLDRRLSRMREWIQAAYEAGAQQRFPKVHNSWIYQYDEELFVVFDPTTDGAHIIDTCESLEQAQAVLNRI
jgi:hypothetical protein